MKRQPKETTMRSIERPTEYDQKIADQICEYISMGMTITEIINDPLMPNRRTFNRWRQENSEFWKQYLIALQDRGEGLIDHLQKIEHDLLNGMIDAPTAKILIDLKKWLAGKFYPDMFGDKATLAVSGMTQIENTTVFYPKDIEILERLRFKQD
jgi:hypothetical protein